MNLVRTLLILSAMMFVKGANGQQYQKLTEMDLSLAQQSFSAPQINRSVSGTELSVAGKNYKNGLGVHSKFVMQIKMNGGHGFRCWVGVNDGQADLSRPTVKSVPLTDGKKIFYDITASKKQYLGLEGETGKIDKGEVVFKVLHNNKEVFSSGYMKQGDPAKEVLLKVKGGELKLIVESGNDGNSGDHAVWLNPEIEYFEVAPVSVSTTSSQAKIEMDKEIASAIQEKIGRLPLMEQPYSLPEQD